MDFSPFAAATLERGGATMNIDGIVNPYRDGYQVAIAPIAHGSIEGASVEDLAEVLVYYAAEYADVVGIPADHDLGTWIDSEGTCHLEETVCVEDFDNALFLAIIGGQYSIWDWANGKEILV